MVKTVGALVPQSHYSAEQHAVKSDAEVNTDNLSPEAARRLKHFAVLVDRFERAASSGAISPPLNFGSETQV